MSVRRLYDIASFETGMIFAENLTGEGSALRWLCDRGLTWADQTPESDALAADVERTRLAETARRLIIDRPEDADFWREEVERYSEPCPITIYVAEVSCPWEWVDNDPQDL